MAISDRLNKLTTDITNAYTSINSKGGIIPANKNTENMSTAINSIEVIETATAEGESLSLANTKAMPYSDYVVKGKSEQEGEPSPEYPSEIHSVADDVNLWSFNNSYTSTSASQWVLSDSIVSIPAGTYTFSYKYTDTATGYLNFKYSDNVSHNNYLTAGSITLTFTEEVKKLALNIVSANNTFYDIKLQKGTEATPYSPYNQGTVTIKQRGTTESDDYIIQTSPLRSLPNGVKDTIEVDGNHKRINTVVFDGSDDEGWTIGRNSKGLYYFYKGISDKIKGGILISDRFLYLNNDTFWTTSTAQNSISTEANNRITGIMLEDQTITTNTDFKTWLSTHNTEVLYPLAEEVIEPLTQNQATTMLDIIKTGSYEGTTNIYTDKNVKPTIGVGYYKKS